MQVDALIFSNAAFPAGIGMGRRSPTLTEHFLRGEIRRDQGRRRQPENRVRRRALDGEDGGLAAACFIRGCPIAKAPAGQEPALKTLDQTRGAGTTLHGQLAATAGDASLRWRRWAENGPPCLAEGSRSR